MYSVDAYGKMITDLHRTNAYVRALQKTVKAGSVVVDLGSGPGFFSLLACKLGARRVYAIEPDDVIQLACECARNNGVSDRVEFIQDFSTNVSLPEPADVVIADLRGVLPFFGRNLPAIQDACNRFLAPEGIFIPACDHLWAAPAHAPVTYQKLEAPWSMNEGVSLSSARNVVMNTWSKSRLNTDDLLCAPAKWHTIDYYNIDSFDVCSEMTFAITKAGTIHGIAIWFNSDLCDGITLSNAPGMPELIYGQGFFPLLQPTEVRAGEEVHFRIRADLIKNDYIWSWETSIPDRNNATSDEVHFKQSTLFGSPLSPSQLRKRASSHTPLPNDDALVNSFIVSQMDGTTTLEQIAHEVVERFSDRFRNNGDALDAVADISARFSK